MALETKPYKGTRDFYPEDIRLRNWMFSIMRKVCESYGYEEYDGPVLEPIEIYTAKTSDEIVNEQSFSFTDRGQRKVIMRPEITPTVSRMVAARRQELGYPLRLYSLANFFRYEKPQKGRLREFYQLNADIFGIDGIDADVEIIQLADSIMKAFGAKSESYEIRINSRKLLDKRVKESEPKIAAENVIKLIDGFEKLSKDDFKEKIAEAVGKPDKLYEFLTYDGASEELKEIVTMCDGLGIKLVPKYSLARGFDYYTDIVFEVFDKNPENNRSLFGGGRYDGLVGEFGVEPVPTVGFGMGDITLENFLRSNQLIPDFKTATDLMVIGVAVDYTELQKIANELRQKGLNVAIDSTERKIDKKIKAADKLGVENVAFVGNDELKTGKYKLKNLRTGKEQTLSLDQLPKKLN